MDDELHRPTEVPLVHPRDKLAPVTHPPAQSPSHETPQHAIDVVGVRAPTEDHRTAQSHFSCVGCWCIEEDAFPRRRHLDGKGILRFRRGPDFAGLVATLDLARAVVLRRVALQLNLRDVRHAPDGGGLRNVLYHVAVYTGRTDVPVAAFTPQREEIDELRYFPAAEVDAMLLRGEMAPNMAFLWLSQAQALLALGRHPAAAR